jgi:uncharacterized protein YjbI with pentapeptide repeats
MTQLPEPQPQDLRNRSFRGMNCEGGDFSGRDIRGCDFRSANLKGANFRGAIAGRSMKQKVQTGLLTIVFIIATIGIFLFSFAFVFEFVFAIVGAGVGLVQFAGVAINAVLIASVIAAVIAVFDSVIFVFVGAIILSLVFEFKLDEGFRGLEAMAGTDFRNADLTDANFSDAVLNHCKFTREEL